MSRLIGDAKPSPDALEMMKSSPYNFSDTKWAAYQNMELGHSFCGHLKFLAIGPRNTFKEAPRGKLPDSERTINWRYYFVGFVNLETGEIEEEE